MVPLWLAIIYGAATQIKRSRYRGDPSGKYFLPGLTIKIVSGIMVGLIYQHYYSNGDTINYYRNAEALIEYATRNFNTAWEIYFTDYDREIERHLMLRGIAEYIGVWYFYDAPAYFVTRITVIVNLFTFGSYYASSIIFSTLSFIGVWGIYRTFVHYFPVAYRSAAYAVLFIPSVCFWGSGILKDSITLGGVGILVYGCYLYLDGARRREFFRWLPLMFLAAFFIFSIKPYILFALLPFLTVWVSLDLRKRSKSAVFKILFAPLLIVVFTIGGYFAVTKLSEDNKRYNVDNVLDTAAKVQDDLTQDYYYEDSGTRGSAYDVGDFEPTAAGVLSKAPISIVTAFFRPLPWEANSPLLLMAALESLVILILAIRSLVQAGLLMFFRALFSSPFILFCICFSVFFGLMVGLTSGNFGNLTRYRIPFIPFLVAALLVLRTLAERQAAINREALKAKAQRNFEKQMEAKRRAVQR